MTNDETPLLPTDPKVVELTERNTTRGCVACDDGADFYVFVTDEMVEAHTGDDHPPDEWPVNAMLCRECFTDAPRTQDWRELPRVAA